MKYILTPKGAAEKTRLTYEYIQYSFQFYKEGRRKLRDLFSKLYEEGVTTVALYGASDLAEIAYLFLQETDLKLSAIVDEEKAGQMFMRRESNSLQDLPDLNFDCILLTTTEAQKEAQEKIVDMGIDEEKIKLLE